MGCDLAQFLIAEVAVFIAHTELCSADLIDEVTAAFEMEG